MIDKKKVASIIGTLISIGALIYAFTVIHAKFRQYHYHEIIRALHSIPAHSILIAIGITIISYFVMTFYDFLAIRYVGKKIQYSKIALSSFITYSFSNNMGHPLITGAIRYRLYSAWDLGAFEIAKVVAFCTFTLWLGFLFLTGLMFSIAPMPIPPELHLSFISLRFLGAIFLAVVFGYLLLTLVRKGEIKFRNWVFSLPTFSMGLRQLLTSSLDWIISGTVMFILLPHGHQIHYYSFLSYFLMAQWIGIASQVPGGLGIFETVMLLMLGHAFPPTVILGVLLAFRVIYYIVPLVLGASLFALMELIRQKQYVFKVVKLYDKIIGPMIPQIFAAITFLAGLILLFSGATPALRHRLLALQEFIPVPVIEISHFLGSIIGIALLFLARGLQRRLNSAYYLTLITFAAGIIVSLLKGFDYEEALTMCLMLLALIPCYRHFYRKSHLIDQPFSISWMISMLLAVASTIWLGFFAHKHVQYSNELWWQFSLHGDASRFLRTIVGIVGFISVFSILRLFRRYTPEALVPVNQELVQNILKYANNTSSNLAYLGDKRFYINESKTVLIMYAVEGKSWVVMGDPIGKAEDIKEAAWQFREYCDRHGGRAVFYEVSTDNLELYLDMGLNLIKIGESARVNLIDYNLESSENKRRRKTIRNVEADGCIFEVLQPAEVITQIDRLKFISDAWLNEKHTKEKGFSLGFFAPEYISLFPVGVVKKADEIIAFANLWTTESKEELSVDLMRYLPGVESSVMEYLFIQMILWGKDNGYKWFDLGMATLSGLNNRALAPLWHRLGSLIFQYGNPLYSLQGLRQYKEKFNPVWEPRYIASQGGLALPEILINLISLISGGYKR